MTCISMTNDEKFNLFTGFLRSSHCLFSTFWRAETAIYTQMSTGFAHFMVIKK